MFQLYSFIVDYKDKNDRDAHGIFQIPVAAFDGQHENLAQAMESCRELLQHLCEIGMKPVAVFWIKGTHTPDDLERIMQTPGPSLDLVRPLWVSDAQAKEFAALQQE